MGKTCDSAFVFRKRCGIPQGKLKVKEVYDPGLNKLGPILLDGGKEADRLWNLRNGMQQKTFDIKTNKSIKGVKKESQAITWLSFIDDKINLKTRYCVFSTEAHQLLKTTGVI